MDLIERYVHAVGKKIWSKQREDIEEEIRSTLYDMLDERTKGRTATEEDVVALLKEYGTPSAVAATYSENKYLIGPEVFPLYLMVLKIYTVVVFFGVTIGKVVEFANDEGTRLGDVFMIIPEYLSAFVGGFGAVTLIFVLIQFLNAKGDLKKIDLEEGWNPKHLPKIVENKREIKIIGPIILNMLIVMAFIAFNFYPNEVGIIYSGKLEMYPIFSDGALRVYVPLWNVVWIASFILNCIHIYLGRWTVGTRIIEILISFANIAVLAFMISGPDLFDFMKFQAANASLYETLKPALDILTKMMKFVFGVGIFGTGIDIIQKFWSLNKDR